MTSGRAAGGKILVTLILANWLAGIAAADLQSLPIEELQRRMTAGSVTSEALTSEALSRISAMNGKLHAVIAVNGDALDQARASDAARQKGEVRSALAGIPVLIKDNIETREAMATTAGSEALQDNVSGRDSPLVAKLRAAGAIILGKTNLSEWANIRSNASVSGWSAVGGLTANPHALARTACGSSSGSGAAIAADLAVLAVGTETDGSIVCPASANGVVGLKPTVGLISRQFIVPISHSQDTPGPMGHHVKDIAAMLTVMAGSDPADPATVEADAHKADFTRDLNKDGLKGLRIGVLRDQIGHQPKTSALFDQALARLQRAGAVLVDIKDSHVDGLDDQEQLVLKAELKADLNAYLASTPAVVKTRSLAELIAFNREHAQDELRYFGQELFEASESSRGFDEPGYREALRKSGEGARGLIDRLLAEQKLALLVAPTMGPAWMTDLVSGDQYTGPSSSQLPAVAGYPHLSLPMGQIDHLPVGLSLIGGKWSEALLLRAGYAFEQTR